MTLAPGWYLVGRHDGTVEPWPAHVVSEKHTGRAVIWDIGLITEVMEYECWFRLIPIPDTYDELVEAWNQCN